MNTFVWIVQILVALVFLAAGAMKLVQPRKKLAENASMAWTQDFSDAGIKGIGGLEVLGALGVILPAATGIASVLTPIASVGLALTMIGAAVTHLRRHEIQAVAAPVILLVLNLVVAWARFGPYAL
ncbi:MAG TPA: DoxX family protein [Pseudonocardia sp.]|uniref:DoxX family protein n=1 Tax=Pseudonocardia sp. TaxID=60912 RepID=UPI002CF7096D|nr:DoxX family protein [Pseudonocardia sp.]HTF46852.1 DoxX family protein [Pseudonocardia sp.]